jgi:hypothetical protein
MLTLEAPLITEKDPCMYNGYIYNKDDVRSPFVKPPWGPWTWLLNEKMTLQEYCIIDCFSATACNIHTVFL